MSKKSQRKGQEAPMVEQAEIPEQEAPIIDSPTPVEEHHNPDEQPAATMEPLPSDDQEAAMEVEHDTAVEPMSEPAKLNGPAKVVISGVPPAIVEEIKSGVWHCKALHNNAEQDIDIDPNAGDDFERALAAYKKFNGIDGTRMPHEVQPLAT